MREFDGIRVIAQPADRGTAPGVLLPLLQHLAEEPEAVVLITPSDHGVGDVQGFRRGLQDARRAVEERLAEIVLLAAAPDAPRVDYGWIVPGEPLGPSLFRVREFVEKPPAADAARLLASGALWNTLVVVARARELRALFDRRCPGLVAPLEAAVARPAGARRLRHVYSDMRPCDLSHEVLTGAGGLAVYALPASIGWNDLGEPDRLLAWLGDAVAPV